MKELQVLLLVLLVAGCTQREQPLSTELEKAFATRTDTPSPLASLTNGKTYHTAGNRLTALHPDGTLKWTVAFEEGLPAAASPTVGPDGNIFLGTNAGLYSFEADGKVRWAFRPGYAAFYTPSIGGDGNLYVCCSNGIWALGRNGDKKWFIEFGPEVQNSLATTQYIPPCFEEVYSEFGQLNSREILQWFKKEGYAFFLPPAMKAGGML